MPTWSSGHASLPLTQRPAKPACC